VQLAAGKIWEKGPVDLSIVEKRARQGEPHKVVDFDRKSATSFFVSKPLARLGFSVLPYSVDMRIVRFFALLFCQI